MAHYGKSFTGSTTVSCPRCGKEHDVSYRYYGGCPERGESGFSLGSPAEDASVEIDEVTCECGEVISEEIIEAKVFESLEGDDD
jgi:hypothetical protein